MAETKASLKWVKRTNRSAKNYRQLFGGVFFSARKAVEMR